MFFFAEYAGRYLTQSCYKSDVQTIGERFENVTFAPLGISEKNTEWARTESVM
jgi:hypothetical protein